MLAAANPSSPQTNRVSSPSRFNKIEWAAISIDIKLETLCITRDGLLGPKPTRHNLTCDRRKRILILLIPQGGVDGAGPAMLSSPAGNVSIRTCEAETRAVVRQPENSTRHGAPQTFPIVLVIENSKVKLACSGGRYRDQGDECCTKPSQTVEMLSCGAPCEAFPQTKLKQARFGPDEKRYEKQCLLILRKSRL